MRSLLFRGLRYKECVWTNNRNDNNLNSQENAKGKGLKQQKEPLVKNKRDA